jgi:hypothetical protein
VDARRRHPVRACSYDLRRRATVEWTSAGRALGSHQRTKIWIKPVPPSDARSTTTGLVDYVILVENSLAPTVMMRPAALAESVDAGMQALFLHLNFRGVMSNRSQCRLREDQASAVLGRSLWDAEICLISWEEKRALGAVQTVETLLQIGKLATKRRLRVASTTA